MRAGVVDRMSFGFSVRGRDGDSWSEDGSERVLRSVVLHEVSVVTGFPAYEATTAAVRSLERLSHRTKVAVDDLVEAFEILADGGQLDDDRMLALQEVVMGDQSEVPDDAPSLLPLKARLTDLLAKKV